MYYVSELVLDGNFGETTADGERKTRLGLYRVVPGDQGGWQTEFVDDGRVLPSEGRSVTVEDAGYKTASDAAEGIVPRASKLLGLAANRVKRTGCDLHFTPGGKRLGGLVRYNALSIDPPAPRPYIWRKP